MIKNAQTVFLISSDRDLNDALADQFQLIDSFKFQIFNNLNDLKDFKNIDLIIFNDINLDLTSLEILSEVQSHNNANSILILSNQLDSRIYGKLKNSDRFFILEKPFTYEYLERVILQNLNSSVSETIYLNEIQFHPNKKLLVVSENNEVKLTEKETDILMFLYSFANRIVSKKQLLNEVWGYKDGVKTHTLETHLYYLRKKLGDDKIISTEKDGYSLSICSEGLI
jgi:DNA-binding response OmpR family regulator